MSASRGLWNSKLGFILAASGSAIGLGNIVFFSSNAYQYGGGAFYLPYFIALFMLGMPVMMLEFGLGTLTGKSFPLALGKLVGKRGEFVGWWSISCALFITMYYIAILGWALGMMIGSFGSLFEAGVSAPFTPMSTPTEAPSATVFFFSQIATWQPMLFILAIWGINLWILRNGAQTIEKAVRIFVPMMWGFMIILVIRGLTLEGGFDGIMYLFTPDLDGISEPGVWKGAFSQMFFSLSLGMGTMTAYASYLPKDADQVNNSMLVSFMNCSFEFLAGIAIFSLLFVFALNPSGTTLSLSFFVIPQGINELSSNPWIVRLFGFLFYLLVVMAGVTSSISLLESPASALIDKFGISRQRALSLIAMPCIIGSCFFALPHIIDPNLTGDGTLGLTLLDITDHWVFNYSLLTVGFFEVILLGWVLGAENIRQALNANAKIKLGKWFVVLVKYVIPTVLLVVVVWSLVQEWPLYGSTFDMKGFGWLPATIPLFWIFTTMILAWFLTHRRTEKIA
jgi:NSS family neurotransmitter:Na+ symporter